PVPDITAVPWSLSPTLAYATGLWWKYSPNTNVYICQVDRKSKTWGMRQNKLSSYVMNGAVCGYTSAQNAPRNCKPTQAGNTQCYVVWEPEENSLGPGNPGAHEFNDAANFPDTNNGEGIGRLHSKEGGNIMSVDGHVEFIDVKRFAAEG